jgi:TolB-like protein/tetratricopeptide (TPR) repeat protein
VTLTPDTKLGPYEIVVQIGAGGMGEVYKATDTRVDRTVALKVLPEEFFEDDDRIARFEREARALASLNHPAIATLYAFEELSGRHLLVMELVEGEGLDRRVSRGPLPLGESCSIARQIAEALLAAHEKGIVHRDLKPANVKVTPDGKVKLLDFGLARMIEPVARGQETSAPTATRHTEAGAVLGTVDYMSPEQLQGLALDQRSDIFSYGATFYEMLSGRKPFRRETASETIAAILRDEPASLPGTAKSIPPAIDRLVRRCLAKSPERRFQSSRDLLAALDDASGGDARPPAARFHRRQLARRAIAIGGAALVAVVLALAADVGGLRTRLLGGSPPGRIGSIAVLPFETLSHDPEQDYFADGVTEMLITDLAQIHALRVISRTSAMQYKTTKKPLPVIGRELNVDAVLEGAVQKAGDRIRITAQLVRAATDQNLWAKSYERDIRDVLALQGEVAEAVADEVRVVVTSEERARLTRPRPVDPEVQELYLKGRYHLNRGTEEEIDEAIVDFHRALAKDPRFALAYGGLTTSYLWLSDVYRPPSEVMPKAKEAAEKAVSLDDALGEAHASLGMVRLYWGWDWAGSERELKRAIEISPNDSSAHEWLGDLYVVLGRFDQSLSEGRRAQQLDPLSLQVNFEAGWNNFMARRFDLAAADFRKAVEIEPRYGWAHAGLAMTSVQKGQCTEAIAEAAKGPVVDDSPLVLAVSGGVYAACGEKEKAKAVLSRLGEITKTRFVCPYEIALIPLGLGERDEAFRYLEEGCRVRSTCMPFLRVDPRYDAIRSDPRYAALVKRIGLE